MLLPGPGKGGHGMPQTPHIERHFTASVVTLLALLVFGYVKGRFTVKWPWRSAWQTVFVGGLAATAALLLAKFIG
jgi:VIT1/CCC1 family predicted Fe2+/Mn2+ transporter